MIHVEHIPIRWGDMDAMNHVNNTIYFRYMEQTRISWYEQAFGDLSSERAEGIVVVNASCTFIRPLTYPGTVEVRMSLAQPGRTSVMSLYELWMNDTKYAEGSAKIVWIDVGRNKAIALPAAVAAMCRPG